MSFLERIKNKNPFAIFFCKKLIFLLVALFVSLSLVFILPHLMPSSPVEMMIGRLRGGETTAIGTGGVSSAGGSVSSMEVLRDMYAEKFGINEPLLSQFVDFWRRAFTLDFGKSYWRYPHTVSSLVGYALPWTMALILPVIPLGFVIGNWIGSRAAYKRGRVDKALYYLSMYMSRAPYYWVGLIFMLVFGAELGWFPIHGAYSNSWVYGPNFSFDWFLDALYHWFLPFLSLVGLGIGGWAVGMRAMTLYEMESDYMQYSKQLGFSDSRLRNYAKDNAILPNFTYLPITINGLVGQTLLVEVVFGYPGLGNLLYSGVFAMDYPLIEATFLITVLIVLLGNFIADILYGVLDPRIGTGYVGEE